MLERIETGEATPMDLEIMASVQEHIIGNCLCVLGDAMAMPIGSMIAKFRERVRSPHRAGREPKLRRPEGRTSDAAPAAARMITFTIDGREVHARPRT